MGYSEDREDQVSVTSFPFNQSQSLESMNEIPVESQGFMEALGDYRNLIINLILVALVF